jgi:serine/threonine-protein kinase
MNPQPHSEYEQLSVEEAARVDATCDAFEQAWKAVHAGGEVPCVASYLDRCGESARKVLLRELVALDRAYRERFGVPIRREDYPERAPAEDPGCSATRPAIPGAGATPGRAVNWPTLPGLELVELLGSGGMGVVFKARQAKLDRDVAVKFLRDAHREGSGQRERFLQEARAVARLHHPHLVQVHEFGEAPGAGGTTSQPYLVLEYVGGATWRTSWATPPCRRGRLRGSSKRWPTPSTTPTRRA